MWEKIKKTLITVLAVFGALFILLLLLPEDKDEDEGMENTEVTETGSTEDALADAEDISVEDAGDASDKDMSDDSENDTSEEGDDRDSQAKDDDENGSSEDADDPDPKSDEDKDTGPEDDADKDAGEDQESNSNIAELSIPKEELSKKSLSFRTVDLDNKAVTQDIFSDYDLTIVQVWGTYCGTCISDMGNYAGLYKELPDNVNLVGIVCDVYDGLDNNVADAKAILEDARAGFTNLRISDSLYDVTFSFHIIPSAFFVDRNGHVVGTMMEGAGFKDVISRLDTYIKG